MKSEYFELANAQTSARNEISFLEQQKLQTFEKEQRLTKSNEQYVEQRRELTQRKEAAIKRLAQFRQELQQAVQVYKQQGEKLESLRQAYRKQREVYALSSLSVRAADKITKRNA